MGRPATDLINKQIGYVTVLRRSERQDKFKRALWICQCKCGKIFETNAATLKTTTNKNFSCGCMRTKSINAGKKADDLVGKRFGWLTVLDRNYTYAKEHNLKEEVFWNCKCDCGNSKIARAYTLKHGQILSCGCLNNIKEDLTNQRFGQLLVLGPDFEKMKENKKNNENGVYWICQCDCGEKTSVITDYLKKTKNPHCEKCHILIGDNLIGQKFNYLTVIERDYNYNKLHNVQGTYWKCLCDCGNYTTVRRDSLINGSTKSCGCMKKELTRNFNMIDMTGQRFGKIVVIEPEFDYAEKNNLKNSGNIIYWKCRCDCGKICYFPGTEIRQGKVNSCSECNGSAGETAIRLILEQYNVKYIYNKSYFKDLISPDTNYCLRYDFIIVDTVGNPKYIIEYDGKQHFEPVLPWGGKERFEYQKRMDTIKNNYALEHNIPLIRIPYTQLKNLTYQDLDIQTSKFFYTTESGYCEEELVDA